MSENIKRDPTKELMLAIDKLQKFAQHNEAEPIPHVHHLDVKEGVLVASENSALKRTMNLMSCFIGSTFSERVRSEQEKKKTLVQNEVLHAIEVLRSHYLFIQKLKKGNTQQQQLAAAAIAAVNRYNAVMDQNRKDSPSWSGKIVRFLYEHCGLSVDETLRDNALEFPQPAIAQSETKKISQKLESPLILAASKKVALCSPHLEILPKQEADAFRVKFISLLKTQGMRFLSFSDQLHSIKVTPIQTVSENSSSVVSMMQTLRPFPGETIVLKGSFRRDAKDTSVPIPDSFHVASESNQTGFPHPSQHTTWALSDQLIPICPMRMDHLLLLQPLYLKKNELAQELLPEGSLNTKAKEILKLKKEAFEKHQDEYLGLLRAMNHAMVKAAPVEIIPDEATQIIDRFFDDKPNGDYLSDIFEIINFHFIQTPHHKLQEAWVEGTAAGLMNVDPKVRYQTALSILEDGYTSAVDTVKQNTQPQSEVEQNALRYIFCMGQLLGVPARAIILQHFSETIGMPPPMLNEYEQRIQAAAYKQLAAFHKELESEISLATVEGNFLSQLQSDIALFSESFEGLEDPAASIVNELEVYYNSRYYASLA